MPPSARLLGHFRNGTDFAKSLPVTSLRHSWTMDREIHETLVITSNKFKVMAQGQS